MKGVLDPKLRKTLLNKVKAQFRLDLRGPHGVAHWMRVRENGLRLCAQIPKADPLVVELFALLHDSQRESELSDINHGFRAASWSVDLDLNLTSNQRTTLFVACAMHSKGELVRRTHSVHTATMAVCWDADRLDLHRPGVFIMPDPKLLSTDAARQLLPWAVARSMRMPTHSRRKEK